MTRDPTSKRDKVRARDSAIDRVDPIADPNAQRRSTEPDAPDEESNESSPPVSVQLVYVADLRV
jgi:hypothetical protein